MHSFYHNIGNSLDNITDQLHILLNTHKITTTTSKPILLNGQSSNIRWIITGAVFGSVLTIGAVFSIIALITLLFTCRKRKRIIKQKRQQSYNTSSGRNPQDLSLLAPYHLVNGSTAIDESLWQDVSTLGKESGGTQSDETTLNRVTADSATIQLTQNVAYHKIDHDTVSGYVILDPLATDSQTGGFSVRYSNSIEDDYDYI